ncbi:MAG TPA: hypothetical protein VNY29_14540 [Terriglobales bacterium]|jgi:hypothetical protein|nr:hypothetical protein [Terriglobales bacterium]
MSAMESAIKVIRAVQIAMLVSVILYVAVGEGIGSVPRLNNPVLFYVLSLVTITIVGVILVVRRTLVLQSAATLAARPNDTATLSRWRAGHIMTYALSEAIAIFGLVLRLIGFSLSQVWSFYIAGFILLLFFGPRRPVSQVS